MPQNPEKEKKIELELSIEEREARAEAHIAERKAEASEDGTVCVDDGCTPEDSAAPDSTPENPKAFMARPGGDAGWALALLAHREELGLSVREVVDLVRDFVQNELGRPFCWHTDTHAHGVDKTGCGHISKASSGEYAHHYGVKHTDVLEMIQILNEMQTEFDGDGNHICQVLDREHKALGALVIDSETYTVQAWSGQEGDSQYFIYNAPYDMSATGALAIFLQDKGYELKTSTLVSTVRRQNDTTFAILAPGADLFEVTFEEETEGEVVSNATFVGKVPTLDELNQK